jgi:hypothetical protein
LVSVHACETIPWILHFHSVLDLLLIWYAELFCDYYWVGIPFGLLIIIYGAYLLRKSERRVNHVAWYVVIAAILLTAWSVWVSLVEGRLYVNLFPLL